MEAAELNETIRLELEETARDMRAKFIRDAYQAVLVAFQHQDAAQATYAEQEAPPTETCIYVIDDTTHLPFIGDEAQHSLGIYLSGRGVQEAAHVGQSMRIFVPSNPADREAGRPSLDEAAQPEYVIVEHTNEDGEVAWYQVAAEGIAPHFPDVEIGDEALEEHIARSVLAEKLIMRAFAARVEARLGAIALLREEMANMALVPQRLFNNRTGEVTDLTAVA
ncbi:MAG: hypothetical protein U0520_01780 [Candidatus Saccharimonadales bacterium]